MNHLRTAKNLNRKVLTSSILTTFLICMDTHAEKIALSWETTHLELVNQHIVPSYQRLLKSSIQLQNDIASYCKPLKMTESDKKEDKGHLDQQAVSISNNFKQLYLNWASVQPINFGPITYLKRQTRMQYWPDKHNVGSKQLRRLLADERSKKLSLDELQKKSVALQGLPALEKIIFSKKPITSANCTLAHRISENIESIARETYDGWIQPPALFMNDFLPKNYDYGTYSSTEEITSVIAKGITHYLAIIEQEKLKSVVEKNLHKNNLRKLEAWRSGISAQLIHANLKMLENMYLSVFSAQLIHKNITLDKNIKRLFSSLKSATQSTASLYERLQMPEEHQKVLRWKKDIRELQELVHQAFNQELGIAFSFNSLDGD